MHDPMNVKIGPMFIEEMYVGPRTLKDDTSTLCRNVGHKSSNDVALYPRITNSFVLCYCLMKTRCFPKNNSSIVLEWSYNNEIK